MKKRILSVLITLVMLVGLVTVIGISASAAGTHSHCICGATHASVGDHTAEQSVEWTAWDGTSDITYTDNAAYLYLTADVTFSKAIKVSEGKTLYLCLNGYSVKSGGGTNTAFWASSGNLVLTDCGTDTREGHIDATTGLWTEGAPNDAGDIAYNLSGGVITGFNHRQGGAISAYNGSVTVFGVNICGNTAPKTGNNYYEGGSAVNATGNVTAKLYNVTMSGNASGNDGGAVMVAGSSTEPNTFTMIGCTLEYNKAEYNGGAIFTFHKNDKVTLEDCIIRKNTANREAGGINIYQGNVTLDNSTLTQNTASSTVGGVYIGPSISNATLTVNRGTRIIGNTVDGAEKNAYLVYNGSIIIGNSGLSDGAKIGVTTYNAPQDSAPISISTQCDADYSSYFLSDNLELYHIENKDNVVVLANGETLKYTVTFDANGQSCTVPDAQTVFGTDRVSEPTVTPEAEGYVFDGWYNDAACTEAFVFGTSITGDITLYAKWIKVYDLWVGGVQVTSANKDDITTAIGNAASGTATYDPETSTLTLNNFSYTGEGYVYDSPWCAAIFSKNDLAVEVVGNNTVTASVTNPYTAEALKVWGALTITGDSGSSLSLTGAGRGGVVCIGDLKIENVTVNATGTSGLRSDEGNITIHNAIVHATATTGSGNYEGAIVANEKNITIENSKVTATAISGYAININGTDYNACTIKNSDVTISNAKYGIRLTSYANLKVENSTLTITATDKAIDAFGGNSILVDNHLVHAGDDAGSATEADASADATYANKYVKIEPVCTVTVNYGVDGVDDEEIRITKGNTISLENPVIDGCLFMGWFTDDTYQTPFNPTTPITESITVYAKFTAAVAKIEKTGTSGLVDTYTITYTDGTTTTFTVTNGEKGDKGDQGIQGIQGVPGADGHTPVITIQNGYWYIDGVNTNQAAQGVKGDKGDKGDTGATGNGIASITTSKANGITTVTIKFTDPNMADVVFTIEDGADGAKGDTGAQGDKGNTGAAGSDGVGIAKIEKTSSDGNVDTYTITLTNGTTYTFTVTNGTNGTDGKDGVDGKDGTNGTNGVDGKDGTDGEDGQTPYIGENGNWWIGDTDTGVKAAGDDGKDGAIIVATAVGSTALISNIALIAWTLIKKKKLF